MQTVSETDGPSDSYSVSYFYNADGDRQRTHYATPSGNTDWEYDDYISLGSDGHRVFRTMKLLDANLNPTAEQFQYVYDNDGRLTGATFGMTPQVGQTDYSPTYPAATRGRAFYDYDMGGRLKSVEYYWDTFQSPSQGYSSAPILKNTCTYDSYKGLKTTSAFWSPDPATGQWKTTADRTEQYGYDANLDYLTSVDYGDGLPNAQQTWTYDAAGNRASDSVQGSGWSYDNLNRITASPGYTYDNDLEGNRLHRYVGGIAETTYTWDELNRLVASDQGNSSMSSVYRVDGLRVLKTQGSTVTRYRYCGDLPIEDAVFNGGAPTVTRYAVGARGIDGEENNGSLSYPNYDCHGNTVAILARTGTTFSLGGQLSFGAWGEVRSGTPTTDFRHCGNLGLRQDEDDLIYMRARYYDPLTGSFASLEPVRQGATGFDYCCNNPVNAVDATGKDISSEIVENFNNWLRRLGVEVPASLKAAELVLAAFSQFQAFMEISKFTAVTGSVLRIAGMSSITGPFAFASAGFMIMGGVMSIASMVAKTAAILTVVGLAWDLELLSLEEEEPMRAH